MGIRMFARDGLVTVERRVLDVETWASSKSMAEIEQVAPLQPHWFVR